MTETSGVQPPAPRAESVEAPRGFRDLAVDYAGYFGVYVAGRGEYDRPSSRLTSLNGMVDRFPAQADGIKLLDAHLERAYELKKGFSSDIIPSSDRDPETDLRSRLSSFFNEGSTRVSFSGTPPDYTFASVRHPVARPLLDLINVAIAVDDSVIDNPSERASRLKSNGEKMVKALVGENSDPHLLMRLTDVEVLEAVFDGRLQLPDSPGKPVSPDSPLRVGSSELPYEEH